MLRVGNVYDDICALENIRNAHYNAKKDKMHYREVKMIEQDPEYFFEQIREMLVKEEYIPSPYKTKVINDREKARTLNKLPYYPDRIIQWAILLQIEKVFVNTLCSHTCASIPRRGGSKAISILERFLKEDPEGTKYALKIDVRKFYPTINREILKQLLRKKFKDKKLLRLLDSIIDSAPYNEFGEEKGVPIGSYLSQYLANYYLAWFDHWLKEDLRLKYVVRYMDDCIILSDSKEQLHDIRKQIQVYLKEKLDIELKDNYQVFPVDKRGIDFIGFVFKHGSIRLTAKASRKLKRNMLRLQYKVESGKMLSTSDWCAIGSYYGRAKMAKAYALVKMYISPLADAMVDYYKRRILPNVPERYRERRLEAYKKKLRKNGILLNNEMEGKA